MRRVLIGALAVAAACAGPLGLRTAAGADGAGGRRPGDDARVIVKYRADSTLLRKQVLSADDDGAGAAGEALGQRIGIALETGRAITDRSQVVFGQRPDSEQLAARIAAESDVEYAVADERKHIVEVPNDPYYASGPAVGATSGGPAVGQWYLKPPGAAGDAANTAPAAINAQQAWDITKGSRSVVVAVLDTGVRFDHPDLQGGNVLPGYDMISPTRPAVFTTANDGNGRDADASDPGDCVTSAKRLDGARLRAGQQLVARHPDPRPDRRGDRQQHRHGQRLARRRQGHAGARARQMRRLRLRHPGRHAVGCGHPGAEASRTTQPRPG